MKKTNKPKTKRLSLFFILLILTFSSIQIVIAQEECDNPRCAFLTAKASGDPNDCSALPEAERQECINRLNERDQRQEWIVDDSNRGITPEEFEVLSTQVAQEAVNGSQIVQDQPEEITEFNFNIVIISLSFIVLITTIIYALKLKKVI